MLVELTPRSAEIIAREQAEHGAISPEQLIEQALEAFEHRTVEPAWFHADAAERRRIVEGGLEDLRRGRWHDLDEVLYELDTPAER